MENAGGNFDGMPSTLLRNLSGIIDGAIAVKRHGGNLGKFSREVQTAIDEWHHADPDSTPRSLRQLSERVRTLSLMMMQVSGEIHYFGGFNAKYRKHANELANAATQAWEWHEAIADDANTI